MIKKSVSVIIIFFFILGYDPQPSSALDNLSLKENWNIQFAESDKSEPPHIEKYNLEQSPGLRDFVKDTAFMYTFVWGGRFFYVRNKDSRIFDTSFSKWIDNITSIDVNDGDSFFTNYVVHTYFGYFYYTYYREMGHDLWTSALGSAVMSTLWEYTIEGLVEPPSLSDLIATPGIGVPVGIAMENFSAWLEEKNNPVAKSLGFVINPMKLFIKDGQRGFLNPLTGAYAFQSSFTVTPAKQKALDLSYPFFLESPLPLGKVSGNIEFINLKKEFGNQLIFYSLRADYPSTDMKWAAYFRIPFAGIDNVVFENRDSNDGWELANTEAGIKRILVETSTLALTAGFEVTLPTIYKDNVQRLEASRGLITRDINLLTRDMITFSPYFSTGTYGDLHSIQASFGTDFMILSEEFEGDFFEFRLNYGLASGLKIPLPGSPLMFVEFNGHTIATADSVKSTDLFVAPGIRLGNRYSPGFRVQIPLSGQTAQFAKSSIMVDMQVRF